MFLSGEAFQTLCHVTWTCDYKMKFHTSLSGVKVRYLHEIEYADEGTILFVYTDLLCYFIETVLPYRTKPFVMVTHNSDESITEMYIPLLEHPLLLHLFSQNTHIRHPKLTALPIGIANQMWPHGNVSHFKQILQSHFPKKKRVYANVNPDTNPTHRSYVMNCIQKYDFVDVLPLKDHMSYLQEMSMYQWVVSPKGNGVDCHRLWECLYAKCIPLVDDTENTRAFKEMGFPLILIQDLNELTMDLLLSETSTLETNVYSPKLDLLYWKQLFHSKC